MEIITFSSEKVIIEGKLIHKIYGGFGPNQPSILAKQIAELHGYELKEINKLIYNNLDWFDEGIDIIDLKSVVISNHHGLLETLLNFYTQEGINRSKYIFLLSQQGYAMLCKLLKSDLARRIYKQMVREYFRMLELQRRVFLTDIIGTAKQAKELAETMGFIGNQATIFINRLICENHAVDLLTITQQNLLTSETQEPEYNATTLGKDLLGGISAQKVNKLLERAGLIRSYRDNKNRLKWDLTEEGKPYGVWKDTTKKHHSGTPVQQLFYKKSIIDILKAKNLIGSLF